MLKKILRFSVWLVLFTVAVYSLHYICGRFIWDTPTPFFELWQIYLFLASLTLVGFMFILFIHGRDTSKTGFTFIGVGFLKMLASIVFLYPLISAAPETLMIEVVSFFVPYFLFLGFELYFVTRLLNQKG